MKVKTGYNWYMKTPSGGLMRQNYEPLGSTKGRELFYHLRDHRLLKKDSDGVTCICFCRSIQVGAFKRRKVSLTPYRFHPYKLWK